MQAAALGALLGPPPQQNVHNSPPTRACVPQRSQAVSVYTAEVGKINQWCATYCPTPRSGQSQLVGFDTEWRPETDRSLDHPTAVIQLAVPGHVLIAHVLSPPNLPSELIRVLSSPIILKGAVGIRGDRDRLERHFAPLRMNGCVEIANLLPGKRAPRQVSLIGAYAQNVLCRPLLATDFPWKQHRITISNWESQPLSIEQREYASMDAILSMSLLAVLKKSSQFFCTACNIWFGSHDVHSHAAEHSIARSTPTAQLPPPGMQLRGVCQTSTIAFILGGAFAGLPVSFEPKPWLGKGVQIFFTVKVSKARRLLAVNVRLVPSPVGAAAVIDPVTALCERLHKLKTTTVDQAGDLSKNKAGIVIPPPEQISSHLSPCMKGQTKSVTITVENTGRHPRTLVEVSLLKSVACCEIGGFESGDAMVVAASSPLPITLSYTPSQAGFVLPVLVFSFESFKIARYLSLECRDEDIYALLKPTAPYVRSRVARPKLKEIEPPPRVEQSTPSQLEATKGSGSKAETKQHVERHAAPLKEHKDWLESQVTDPLTKENYRTKMQSLLLLEELQMREDIKTYDIPEAQLEPTKGASPQFWLRVPGLSEGRPSVLKGDVVRVAQASKGFDGRVVDVEMDKVLLAFGPKMAQGWIRGTKYHISFSLNTLPLSFQHNGIKTLSEPIFPITGPGFDTLPHISLFNRQLNVYQAETVQRVLSLNSPGGPPYLIHGPPGTGKTTTVVECIVQLIRASPSARVLLCAPSNDAVDLLAVRLRRWGMQPRELLRVHAASRSPKDVDPEVIACSLVRGGDFYLPGPDDLKGRRVVVSTCVSAARVPDTRWSHVFIDEAGHAMETEALISIAKGGPDSQVVLAGDWQQLGPVVHSAPARECGLALSLLERLSRLPLYEFSPEGVCKGPASMLRKNYRSHPDIIEVPNNKFYHGLLQAAADRGERETLCGFAGLPTPGFPLIFHSVVGKDEQESRSPSWFNPSEAVVVKSYLEKLMDRHITNPPVLQTDIGVVTPYHKQAVKLRKLFVKEGWEDIKVGSVEQFQGQERRVIIVSTVRSTPSHTLADQKFNLGFLAHPKRFNVSLTRAKALCVVVGNGAMLRRDEHWGALFAQCEQRGAVVGEVPPSEDSAVEELEMTVHNLRLADTESPESSELSDGIEFVDAPVAETMPFLPKE